MENQFHEMGLTSVVIACYKDSDGRPVINWYETTQTHDLQIINNHNWISFDHIAKLMGVPSTSFVDTYNQAVTDLMVKLVEYVQAIDKILNPIHGPNNSTGHSPDGVQLKPIHLKSTTLEKNEK